MAGGPAARGGAVDQGPEESQVSFNPCVHSGGGPAQGIGVASFALNGVLANLWPQAGALRSERRRCSEYVLAFSAARVVEETAALNVRACPWRVDASADSTRHLPPLTCRAAGSAAQVQQPGKRFAVSGSHRALRKR